MSRPPDYTFKGALNSFAEAFSGCLTLLTVVFGVMLVASVVVLAGVWFAYPGSHWWLGPSIVAYLVLLVFAFAWQYGNEVD